MSKENPITQGIPFRIGPWKANGFSIGAQVNWLVIKKLDLIIDIGAYVEPMEHISRLFLSHLHIDHCAGLAKWVIYRQKYAPQPVLYVPRDRATVVEKMLEAAGVAEEKNLDYRLVGLADGERIELEENRFLEVFETDHQVPTLGFVVYEKRKKVSGEYRNLHQEEIARAVRRGEDVFEWQAFPLLGYTADTTASVFDRKPDLLEAETLVSECTFLDSAVVPKGSSEDMGKAPGAGVVDEPGEEVEKKYHIDIDALAERIKDFRGKHLVIDHVQEKYTGTDLYAYLLPRLPKEQRAKLQLVPYRCECRGPENFDRLGRDGSIRASGASSHVSRALPGPRPAEAVESLAMEELSHNDWEVKERPGHSGWKRREKHASLEKKYGEYSIAYLWGEKLITRQSALQLYEDSYYHFLAENELLLKWLVEEAGEVYDNHVDNIDSGIDYFHQQEGLSTHLQDIAVRRALIRLGRWFEGQRMIQIRGLRSEGYVLNPGIVPFVEPEKIAEPAWTRDWCLRGSVESFWQSNKVVVKKGIK